MEKVYEILENLNIKYEVIEHKPVFTVTEAKEHRIRGNFGENKNLFLRNKKGSKHYLVTLGADKDLDIKKFENLIGDKKIGFASGERLKKYLNLAPGSVSPFGLLNDTTNEVTFVLDEDLLKHEYLGFHPNINTRTIIIKTEDFRKYLEFTGNRILFLSI